MIARDHHYLFSHAHLRNQALRHPDRLLEELRGPVREGFLFHLWQQVEEVASEKVSAAGLHLVGIDQVGGGTMALIQLPAPERDTESLFAAFWHGPSGARYFVFDRAVGEPDQATLAELELDDTRINMGRHPATQQALLDVLASELSTPRPPSVRPTPPTVAMSAAPSVPPAAPTPGPMPSAPGMAPPAPAAPKRKRKLPLILIPIALAAPLLCCLGTGFMAYDSGLDPDSSLTVDTELSTDSTDHERLVIRIDGPEEIWSFRVEGPGAVDCDFLSHYSGPVTCEVALGVVADPSPSYRITATGSGPRLFDQPLDDMVELEQTVEVERTLGLAWSESAGTTVVRGFPGRLDVTDVGSLRVVDAPSGTSLMVGQTSDPVEVPLDLVELVGQVGLPAVFSGTERVSVQNVNVRMPDGTTAGGTAQLRATDLAPALLRRFSALGDAELGEATGDGAIWIADGQLRELAGSPQTLADVGRVVLTDSVEVRSGRCGPYALWGVGIGSRIPRMRWRTTVEVYDRVEGRRVRVRRFSSPRPSCPYSIQSGTPAIHGTRDTTRADEYARGYLHPEE